MKIVSIIYRKLFFSVYKKGQIVKVKYLNTTFNVPTNDITILPSMLNGEYEKLELNVLQKLLKPGDTFVDVGANIGIHTVLAAKRVGSKGKVFSFEPEAGNLQILKRNLEENRCQNVTVVQAAVGNKKGRMTFYVDKRNIGTHSLLTKHIRADRRKEVQVDVVTLNDYFNKRKLGIDVMKIDVEGYEPAVLLGSRSVLKKVTYLLFEYDRNLTKELFDLNVIVDVIKSFPFQYNLDEKKASIIPFSKDELANVEYANLLLSKVRVKL